MKIKWLGPVFDPSGYGVANRDYIKALHFYGNYIKVSTQGFVVRNPELYPFIQSLVDIPLDYDIVVHHYVPNRLYERIEPKKFNVGYNTWETDRIPDHWVDQLNKLDLVLVPSTYNKKVYQSSGVTVPIEVISHCVDLNKFDEAPEYLEKFDSEQIRGRFKFFSVFQWTERKNPINLLKAYFSAFYNNNNDKVVLVLKTFRSNTSHSEKLKIISQIKELKEDMRFFDETKIPPVCLLTEHVSDTEMASLYKMHDCFVLPTRSEGFGLPIMEALISKMPVITTNYSGHLDFCCTNYNGLSEKSTPKDGQLCYLLPCQMTPVAHMKYIPFYDGTQSWAEPDVMNLKEAMRYVYYGLYPYDPSWAAYFCRNKVSYERVAEQFTDAIKKHLEYS